MAELTLLRRSWTWQQKWIKDTGELLRLKSFKNSATPACCRFPAFLYDLSDLCQDLILVGLLLLLACFISFFTLARRTRTLHRRKLARCSQPCTFCSPNKAPTSNCSYCVRLRKRPKWRTKSSTAAAQSDFEITCIKLLGLVRHSCLFPNPKTHGSSNCNLVSPRCPLGSVDNKENENQMKFQDLWYNLIRNNWFPWEALKEKTKTFLIVESWPPQPPESTLRNAADLVPCLDIMNAAILIIWWHSLTERVSMNLLPNQHNHIDIYIYTVWFPSNATKDISSEKQIGSQVQYIYIVIESLVVFRTPVTNRFQKSYDINVFSIYQRQQSFPVLLLVLHQVCVQWLIAEPVNYRMFFHFWWGNKLHT